MKVYEVIATRAKNDWAEIPGTQSLGLYNSAEGAQYHIETIMRKPHWRMDYSSFCVVPRKIK